MEQAQILAKWLMMVRTARHELRETGNLNAADVALDRLSVQIMIGKIFGLPHDVPVYREEARDVINAYVESVIARVESIATRGLVCEEVSYRHRGVADYIDTCKTRCKDCDRRLTPLERANYAQGFRKT